MIKLRYFLIDLSKTKYNKKKKTIAKNEIDYAAKNICKNPVPYLHFQP
jgi:hypothetical protein